MAEAADPAPLSLPTTRKIAARLRHAPAGVVIGDICRYLGIMPGHELWPDTAAIITENGGGDLADRFVELVRSFRPRAADPITAAFPIPQSEWDPAAAAVHGTGPP